MSGDIRESLLANGIEMKTDTDPAATGPAHIVIHDPDGNPILIDQFFPRPGVLEQRAKPVAHTVSYGMPDWSRARTGSRPDR